MLCPLGREIALDLSSGEHCPRTQLCGGHLLAPVDGYGSPELLCEPGQLGAWRKTTAWTVTWGKEVEDLCDAPKQL